MKVNLIRIGNSKGVRLPRSIIKECGFGDQIEMRVEQGVVLLAQAHGTREGWDDAFARMATERDDTLIIADTIEHGWDEQEWER